MYGRLIGVDKHPGVHLFGVKETWWRCMGKVFYEFSVTEAKEDCGTYHMCGVMNDGIEDMMYAINML